MERAASLPENDHQPISLVASLLGTLVLFLALELIGMFTMGLFGVLLQLPHSSVDIQQILRGLPRFVAEIFRLTVIPTAIYAFLIVWLGFRPNRHRSFGHVLLLCAGLALLFVLTAIPIGAYLMGGWEELWLGIQNAPSIMFQWVFAIAIIAIFTGIVSAFIVRQFFRFFDHRQHASTGENSVKR